MTTDTIPEAREAADSWDNRLGKPATTLPLLITQACLAYHKRMSQDLQQKLTTYEGQTRFFCECGGVRQREEELQKQCEELRKTNDNWQAVVKDDCENEQDVRNLCKPYVQEVEHDGYGVIPIQNVVEKAFDALKKERDDLRNRAEKAEAEAKQWEQSSAESVHKLAKAQAEVAELKGEHERMENSLIDILVKGTTEKQFLSVPEMQAAFVKDQLTQLQQDVRPLLALAMQNHHGNAVVETFLAKHPSLKP